MEVVNETIYNSEDLILLWRKIREEAIRIRSQGGFHASTRDLPEILRVGYYTPRIDEEAAVLGNKAADFTHARLSSRYSYRTGKPPRLGIVRRKLYKLTPIEHLAMTAADEMTVPYKVLLDIAGESFNYFLSYGTKDKGPETWEWLQSFKLRVRGRAKRGTVAEAAKKRKKMHLSSLYTRRSRIARNIRALESKISEKRDNIAAIDEQIEKLEKEVQ